MKHVKSGRKLYPITVSIFLLPICLLHTSCVTYFYSCIRNTTSSAAQIDVFLLDKHYSGIRADSVRIAKRTVDINGKFFKSFKEYEKVEVIDSTHLRMIIQPNTTVDLTNIGGRLLNGLQYNIRLTVTSENKIDTLFNGKDDYSYYTKFKRKGIGFPVIPILYYDVE